MNFEKIKEYLWLVWEKLRYNPIFYTLLLAIFLGLSCGRLASRATLLVAINFLPPVAAKPAKPVPLRQSENYVDPAVIIGGALFSPVSQESEKNPEGTINIEPIKHFRLIGTIEGDPEFARAILEISGEPTQEYCISKKYCDHYRVGDIYIVGIGREYIYFRYQGKRLRLESGQSTQEVIEKHNAELAKEQSQMANPAGVEVITKVVSREEVNKTILGNPTQIYIGASFGPTIQDGKITGYKIHKVNPDHVFYKLGARPGDIIRKVNDYPLSDTERMFELWKSIKDMPRVKIEVEREGKTYIYDFHVRN